MFASFAFPFMVSGVPKRATIESPIILNVGGSKVIVMSTFFTFHHYFADSLIQSACSDTGIGSSSQRGCIALLFISILPPVDSHQPLLPICLLLGFSACRNRQPLLLRAKYIVSCFDLFFLVYVRQMPLLFFGSVGRLMSFYLYVAPTYEPSHIL